MLTIACSKGKLLGPTLECFARAGYTSPDFRAESRRLVFPCADEAMTFLIVRPSDVPTYVEYGGADAGIVGKDVLLEHDRDVYEPLDLRFGSCRIVVAAVKGRESSDRLSSKIRVATKYPRIAERYFNQQGHVVELIKLYGSIELAPVVGLADRIVDLVSTGRTLQEHNLVEVDVITQSTARLIVNRASLKMKHQPLAELIERLKKQISSQGGARQGHRHSRDRHASHTHAARAGSGRIIAR